jgi:acyl-CoA thioesterase-1
VGLRALLSTLLVIGLLGWVTQACSAPRGTILVYGDSLSAGYGLAQGEAWPSLLQQRLKKEGFEYNVVNASISGETSAGGASRIGSTLAQGHPAVTVLELGANDGLRGLPAAQMRDNLARIIRALQAAGSKVLIVGMRLPPNYGPVYLKDFEGSFAQLAKTHKTAYLPFLLEGVADKPDLFQADQLHPIASAQPRVLDNVWEGLRPLLAK